MRIGSVGLGIMGGGVTKNLLAAQAKAGWPSVCVYNRTAAKLEPFLQLGATAAATPRDVAAQSDVVFTNVSDSADVEHVVLDPETGILAGAAPGTIIVDNSTIKPSTAIKIAEICKAQKGVFFLDAPVSGGDVGARDGTLAVMVGGDAAALEKVQPILKVISKSVVRIGDSGAGQVAKAANQIMVAAQMTAQAELLVFAQKMNVDPETVVNAIKGGAAACWTLDVKPPRIFAGNRMPGFKCKDQMKDLKIVLDTCDEAQISLPVTALNTQMFQGMLAHGEGHLDNSAVLGQLERMNDTSVGPAAVAAAEPKGEKK